MLQIGEKNKYKGGYTLIEVIVAVGIFSLILSIPTGFFVFSLTGQRKALAMKEITDNASSAFERMTIALRMVRKDLNGDCLSTSGANYENPGSDQKKIRFLNYDGKCQEFSLINGQLNERKSPTSDRGQLSNPLPITSDNLQITPDTFQFLLSGQNQGDQLQPRVTIFMEIYKKNQITTKMTVQTTVSQRNLDVTY